jgi:hypothetical protein
MAVVMADNDYIQPSRWPSPASKYRSMSEQTIAHNAVALFVLMLPVHVPTIAHNRKASVEQE